MKDGGGILAGGGTIGSGKASLEDAGGAVATVGRVCPVCARRVLSEDADTVLADAIVRRVARGEG